MSIKPLHGWLCPLCGKLYETEERAQACINAHIEYPIEPRYVMSSPYPVNIRVWKEVAGQRVEWKDYNPEKEVHTKHAV